NLTPPGDFKFPLENDWKILDDAFLPILKNKFSEIFSKYVVVLNRIPGPDRTVEIIVGGNVIATLIHENMSLRVSLKPIFYNIVKDYLKDIFITADPGAIDSIKNGKNLMAPGVIKLGENVKIGNDAFIKTPENKVFALGISKIDKEHLINRGMAVKIKYVIKEENIKLKESSIKDVIEGNATYMKKAEEKAIKFLRKFKNEKIIVSFSGGKDSLVALHLTLKAGIKPKVVFLDTGLEFKETKDYVKDMLEEFSLNYDIISAGDAFFKNLEHFGPPGRDYRWCCKVCKLGPTTRYIKSLGNEKIYMVIGQRAYESSSRSFSGNIWENEWVPNQIGISPIQNWDSFMIWLYIFMHKLKYNSWYDRGLWRIGCFMCPSQDLADLSIVSKSKIYEKWDSYLREYALKNNLKEEWVEYGLWRWNKIPEFLKRKYSINDHVRQSLILQIKEENGNFKLIPNKNLNLERLKNIKNILPNGVLDDDLHVHKNFIEKAMQVIYQSEECVGCGICTGRCERNALFLNNGKVWVNEDSCIHCTKCLGPCPAYVFR
ncbi:MAG: phosphoadenosine phosphosulfate reductase family protein, partial [Thermoplasmata archaeon]